MPLRGYSVWVRLRNCVTGSEVFVAMLQGHAFVWTRVASVLIEWPRKAQVIVDKVLVYILEG